MSKFLLLRLSVSVAAILMAPLLGLCGIDSSEATLQDVSSHYVTSNSALLRWCSVGPGIAHVRYGVHKDALERNSGAFESDDARREVVLLDLRPGTTYYYQAISTDEVGVESRSQIRSFTTMKAGEVFRTRELSQWGITWTFDRPHVAGRFINGDWWVVGPVTIISVSPAPGPAIKGEQNSVSDGPNRWGDAGQRNDDQMRNGSMIVLKPANRQGYDSRGLNYDPQCSIEFPYTLPVNHSLISSVSYDRTPNLRMFHELMWENEKRGNNAMRTAAVLTCLSEAPPEDAFRPGYAGTDKRIFRESDLQWDRLLNLESPMPAPWSQFERYFQRVWLDDFNGSWNGQQLLPNENQASYGREIVRMVGQASLMLLTDASRETKRRLLIGLVQNGIDLRTLVELGAYYNEGGGHTSGRKWPILFAGIMLDEDWFFRMPETAVFHEDTQTYYGEGWAGQTALWQMVIHHGVRKTYMHLHPDEWPAYDEGWARHSEGYRTCCTLKAWPGQTLAALLLGAKSLWNHNAYFDGVDDWMREEDIYAAKRAGARRPSTEGSSFEPFVDAMWRLYRDEVPEQADGTDDLMWVSTGNGGGLNGHWVKNPRPGTQ